MKIQHMTTKVKTPELAHAQSSNIRQQGILEGRIVTCCQNGDKGSGNDKGGDGKDSTVIIGDFDGGGRDDCTIM